MTPGRASASAGGSAGSSSWNSGVPPAPARRQAERGDDCRADGDDDEPHDIRGGVRDLVVVTRDEGLAATRKTKEKSATTRARASVIGTRVAAAGDAGSVDTAREPIRRQASIVGRARRWRTPASDEKRQRARTSATRYDRSLVGTRHEGVSAGPRVHEGLVTGRNPQRSGHPRRLAA